MIARLIIGGIVVYPTYYLRPGARGFLLCVALALTVALVIPDHWHDD